MQEASGLTITNHSAFTDPVKLIEWLELDDGKPAAVYIDGVDLVVVRWDDHHSVLSGRCRHRGALLADGRVDGPNLICGVHGWDCRMDTGVSSYDTSDRLRRFRSTVKADRRCVRAAVRRRWPGHGGHSLRPGIDLGSAHTSKGIEGTNG